MQGLSDKVCLIAGGEIADGYVVTPKVKAGVVSHLQKKHNLYVWAFGDSPLDIGMLRQADQALVVAGDKATRSKSMNEVLRDAIANEGFLG